MFRAPFISQIFHIPICFLKDVKTEDNETASAKDEEGDTQDELDQINKEFSDVNNQSVEPMVVLKQDILTNMKNVFDDNKGNVASNIKPNNQSKVEKNVLCPVCGKAFRNESDVRDHFVNHTGEKPYKCDVCQKSFGFRTSLYHHKKRAHVQEIERGETVLDMKQIKYKERIGIPKENIGIYPCSICDKQFYSAENLHIHFLRFHEESQAKQTYLCNTCPR